MMSLVPVESSNLIVAWGLIDVGSGESGDINMKTTYELKTEVSNHPYTYMPLIMIGFLITEHLPGFLYNVF